MDRTGNGLAIVGVLVGGLVAGGCGPGASPGAGGATGPAGGVVDPTAAGGGAGDEGSTAGPPVWSAGVVPAWRVPRVILDVIALDAERAIAVNRGKFALVDLTTGTVTQRDAAFGSGSPSQTVRAGGRLLAYGRAGKAAAVWAIDPTTLAITPLTLPEPAAGAAPKGRVAIAVSPDGSRLLTCSEDRWPTLRDATTLAPVRVFTAVEACANPRFVDANHALVDRHDVRGKTQALDLRSGKVAAVKPGSDSVVPGPGGRSATIGGRSVTLTGADGRQLASHTASLVGPVWLGDGSALVSSMRGRLTVLPAAAGQASRTVELPAPTRHVVAIPGSPRLIVQFGPHRLGVVDVAAGTVTTADHANLGAVSHLAVLDGTVISAADRVRVWRDRSIVATGPTAVVEMIDADPGKPVVYATLDGVFAIDAHTGAPTPIDDGTSSTAVDRDGERTAYDSDDRVMVRAGPGETHEWFRRSSDFFVTDIDVATGRVALTDDDAFYVARPARQALFGFHAYDCGDPLYLYLDRGRERAAAYDGVTVHLYDTGTGRSLGGLELVDDNIEALAFIPGSESLVVVGGALYLWDPTAHTVASWALPAEVAGYASTAVAVDPSGRAVAVGFADGALIWARLDEIRAHAAPVGADVASQLGPVALRCKRDMVGGYDDLRDPDDDVGDADDAGDEDDADDDGD